MKVQLNLKRHAKRGFTLIEMLITVAIIAILVGILVPAMHTVKFDAQKAKQDANMSAVTTAKTRYLLQNNEAVGEFCEITQIAPFLLINGETVSDDGPTAGAQVIQGTGATGIDLGKYPQLDGTIEDGYEPYWIFEAPGGGGPG